MRPQIFFLNLFLLGLPLFSTQPAQGQVLRTVPSAVYFDISMARFNRGEFDRALADFNNDLRDAVKIGTPSGQVLPWLDSLCYLVMIGECHYQMARYEEAMLAFNQAVQVYLTHFDWLRKIGFTGTPVPVARTPFPWGQSTRQGNAGNFRNCTFKILQESLNMLNLGRQGAAFAQQTTASTIFADEIISRMGLMIRRRAEILGPLSQHDPLTKELNEVLGGRPCLPNHFTGVWVDVLYGLSLAAMGDAKTAEDSLKAGLLMERSFDHQLTGVALFELGNISLRAGKLDEAQKYFLETTFAAYFSRDTALLSDAFRSLANVQKTIDKTKPVSPPFTRRPLFFPRKKKSAL